MNGLFQGPGYTFPPHENQIRYCFCVILLTIKNKTNQPTNKQTDRGETTTILGGGGDKYLSLTAQCLPPSHYTVFLRVHTCETDMFTFKHHACTLAFLFFSCFCLSPPRPDLPVSFKTLTVCHDHAGLSALCSCAARETRGGMYILSARGSHAIHYLHLKTGILWMQ